MEKKGTFCHDCLIFFERYMDDIFSKKTAQLKSVPLQSGGVSGGAQEQAQDVQLLAAVAVDAVVQVSVHWTEALAEKSELNAQKRNLNCYTNHYETQLFEDWKCW